jgi:hypothetical protein
MTRRSDQPSASSPAGSATRTEAPQREAGSRDASSVPCVYCMAAIPSGTFVYWTHATRLLSADCPQCTRRTTLAVRGLGPLPLPGVRGIAVLDPIASPAVADAPTDLLCACGHPLGDHDVIAARYCDATLAGVLPRGCICLRTHQRHP